MDRMEFCIAKINLVQKRIDELDAALRVWAVRTYDLISPGPPPKYRLTWSGQHLAVVKGWENFKERWRRERRIMHATKYGSNELARIETYDIAVNDMKRCLEKMGVRTNDHAVELVQVQQAKVEPIPWSNTLVLVGGMGLLAYATLPHVTKLFNHIPPPLTSPRLNDERIKAALGTQSRRTLPAKPERPLLAGPTMGEMSDNLSDDFDSDYDNESFDRNGDPDPVGRGGRSRFDSRYKGDESDDRQ